MPLVNFTNPVSILVALVLFLLVLYLGKEMKKSWIIALLLFAFVAILIGHTVEFMTIVGKNQELYQSVTGSATFDLIFIFLSFISYLWIDSLEVKEGKKKSIDNSLEWFWNKV